MTTETTVLIAGGGPVGLAASIGLSRHGIDSILVERHPGTALHPKARGVDVRTMEVFRQWGIEPAVRAAGLAAEALGYFYRGATLTSPEFERSGGGGRSGDARRLSPTTWLVIGQDALEPVLLEATRTLGRSDVRFGHELAGFDQDDEGVTATIMQRASGRPETVRARYLIGADGAGSRTRELLGVGLDGRGPLVWNASILFRADLEAATADRASAVYYLAAEDVRPRGYPLSVGNPPPNGVILTIDGRERWLLVVALESEAAPPPDAAAAAALVREAVGIADLDVEILGVLPWTPAARVASRYRTGRAFLAGDAAHEMTPSGAFGLNVGIQDAHNLAWKLAFASRSMAGPGLLDSYDPERRPIGRFAADQSYLQFSGEHPPRPFGNWGVILGSTYASDAVIPDGSPAPRIADRATEYAAVARPGHRAPHAWLGSDATRSTIDLVGDDLAVLSRDPAWVAAADRVAAAVGSPIRSWTLRDGLAPSDPDAFDEAYGIGEAGAVLVRPDGYVGWRSVAGPAAVDRAAGAELEFAVRRILDR
jgi:putative polyketide hydroxylase